MKTCYLLGLMILLFVAGCSKPIEQMEIKPGNHYEKQLKINPDKALEIWTDLEVNYTDDVITVQYDISFFDAQNKFIDRVTCDAFNVSTKLWSTESTVMYDYYRKYQGNMRYDLKSKLPENLILKIKPIIAGNIKNLSKCNLIFKQ